VFSFVVRDPSREEIRFHRRSMEASSNERKGHPDYGRRSYGYVDGAQTKPKWEEPPYVRAISVAHNRRMSMYVEILSGAIDDWHAELTGDALVDYVLSCRAALPDQDLGAGVWSESTLVAEVTYDRALVNLAAEYGVDVTPTNFVHPRIERDRLELALAQRGLDLTSPLPVGNDQADSAGP
jgi:hypothetical protein